MVKKENDSVITGTFGRKIILSFIVIMVVAASLVVAIEPIAYSEPDAWNKTIDLSDGLDNEEKAQLERGWGSSATYDESTHTLTLRNVSFSTNANVAIFSDKPLVIDIRGNCYVSSLFKGTEDSYGIRCTNDLDFKGSGTLIVCSGDVTAKTDGISAGIRSNNMTFIGPNVDAKGGDTTVNIDERRALSTGIYVDSDLEIGGGSAIKTTGGTANSPDNAQSFGSYIDGLATIKEGSELTSIAGPVSSDHKTPKNCTSQSVGMMCLGALDVSESVIIAKASSAIANRGSTETFSTGVQCDIGVFIDSHIEASSDISKGHNANSFGMHCLEKNIYLKNTELIAEAGMASCYGDGTCNQHSVYVILICKVAFPVHNHRFSI